MKITQRRSRWLSRLVLVSALFAQGILAAHACVAPDASAVRALSIEPVAEAMPCHEASKPNVNECLMHCTQSDQVNLDQLQVAAVHSEEVVLHVALPAVEHKKQTVQYSLLPLNTGPPLTIRYCSFLI